MQCSEYATFEGIAEGHCRFPETCAGGAVLALPFREPSLIGGALDTGVEEGLGGTTRICIDSQRRKSLGIADTARQVNEDVLGIGSASEVLVQHLGGRHTAEADHQVR